MKKIGVIVDNEFDNDIRVVTQCNILKRNGFKVFVLCFNLGQQSNEGSFNGVFIHRIKLNIKLKNILFALNNTFELYNLFWSFHIKKFINRYNIDALHVHDLYMSKPAYYATKGKNIAFNLDLHENYPTAVKGYKWMHKFPNSLLIRPEKWERIEHRYLNYAKNIIVLSEAFKTKLLKKYKDLKPDQLHVYPNVPDIKEFSNYEINPDIIEKKEGEFILFYFGGISKRRGIYVALEALEYLTNNHKEIKLLLIGPIDKNEKQEFLQLFQKNSVSGNLIYYEWKDISLLPSFITVSDICLSPIEKNDQHESGVANKVFQYMLFERPIIVSNCKPQEKIVVEEECGLIHQHDDAEDLANKILELYNNEKLRDIMGKNGKKAIEEKYNTEIVGKSLVNLYTET